MFEIANDDFPSLLRVIVVGKNIPAIEGLEIIPANKFAAGISADMIFVVADGDGIAEVVDKIDGSALKILITDKKVDACAKFDTYFIGGDAEKIIRGIISLITLPGVVSLDFSDLKLLLENSGEAIVLVGEGDTAVAAVKNALKFAGRNFRTARSVVFSFTCPRDNIFLKEISDAGDLIQQEVAGECEFMCEVMPSDTTEKISVVILASHLAG